MFEIGKNNRMISIFYVTWIKLLTKRMIGITLDLIISKGSKDMYLFGTEKLYNIKKAMHHIWHGLIVVCEYFSYGEK